MKLKCITLLLFILIPGITVAQDADSTATVDTLAFQQAEARKPVRDAFASTMLVDLQTGFIPPRGSVEIIIQHRFSNLSDGISDLFGIYGASNIRLAVQYSIIDRLMIGFGTEKDHKYQEFYLKANILEQTKNNKMPLTLTFFGNAAIMARNKTYFGANYRFIDRMSYFAQLMVSRRFCRFFSVEAAASYSHFNKVEGIKTVDTIINQADPANSTIRTSYPALYQNDVLGISAGARVNFYRGMSLLLEYDQGFYLKKATPEQLKPKPNLALAYEISTSTHCFQVFVSSYRGIVPQQNFVMNQFDFTKAKGLMIGFNITVRIN